MTASTVDGSGNRARPGALALSLLAVPLKSRLLRALAGRPTRQIDLRRATGSPALTTVRAQLKAMEAIGAIAKRRDNAFPRAIEYELEKPGRELLSVVATLDRWLASAPGEPLELGTSGAKAAIGALAEAWSTKMLRTLAARPLALTELDRVIPDLSYPALERRLGALRLAGLIEARRGEGPATPYAVTDWLRRGAAPLAVAARWERRNALDAVVPIGQLDVEAFFLLALPLLRLPADLTGRCRLVVELSNGEAPRFAGVLVDVSNGRIASYTVRLEGDPVAWASGSPTAWLSAVIDTDPNSLELGGDCVLVRTLLAHLSGMLFADDSTDRSKMERATS